MRDEFVRLAQGRTRAAERAVRAALSDPRTRLQRVVLLVLDRDRARRALADALSIPEPPPCS